MFKATGRGRKHSSFPRALPANKPPLETIPDDVTECVTNESMLDQVDVKYTVFCDPQLNLKQVVSVVFGLV